MTNNPNEQILSKPLIDNDYHLHLRDKHDEIRNKATVEICYNGFTYVH
ncbi:hypothetical protein PLEI_3507 [Photobacterium leiognathi lrivu.4.1]|uniref:Uncharacterized protein n=1 Tax=Photobacterium leiognathi lrivu.4.1 TaxID=1248232 RepID=V5F6W2_PHOLE|nr:hypothetical protein PLEI_3507 [Photobacterium leiognathi lrivu.4.1]